MENSTVLFSTSTLTVQRYFFPHINTIKTDSRECRRYSFISEFILRVMANTAFHRDVDVQLELLMGHLLLSLTGGEIKAMQAPNYRL